MKLTWRSLIIAVLFLYLLGLQAYYVWPFTIDDMYIPLRYAAHFIAGDGLTWNINEAPVEGYSNFTFVMIAALAMKWGFNPVTTLKIIGVSGLGLSTLSLYFLTRLWFSRSLAWVPSAWFLVYWGDIIWAVSGLETTLYQAFAGFGLYFFLRGLGYCPYPQQRRDTNLNYLMLAALLFTLASFTRPEAPFLMVLFGVIAWFDESKDKSTRKKLVFFACLFGLLYTPYFIWRWIYFGRLFPNPIYCKGFADDFLFVLDKAYLKLAWPFLMLSLASVPCIANPGRQKNHPECNKGYSTKGPQPNSWSSLAALYFLLPSVLYSILLVSADPVVAFENRLFLPCFMLLLVIAFVGLRQLISKYASIASNLPLYLIAGSVLVSLLFIPKKTLYDYQRYPKNAVAGEKVRKRVIQWLNEKASPESHVVLGDSGLIPYESSLFFTDSYCLNNKRMTEISQDDRYEVLCHEILKDKNNIVILISLIQDGRVIYAPADVCFHERFKGDHQFVLRAAYQVGDNNFRYRYEIFTDVNEGQIANANF